MSHVIRQLEERHVSVEIKILKWNDRMDLLALANVKGEVSLHRLTWQRVWCLRPEQEDVTVTDMTWRPDGKILAIAYSDGNVLLAEVENKHILHKISISFPITSLDWQQDKQKIITTNNNSYDKDRSSSESVDDSSIYLMSIPSLSNELPTSNSSSSDFVDLSFFKNQSDLNILLIGTENGQLHLSIFGIFTCALIDINWYVGRNCKILKSQFSNNFDTLYVTILDDLNNISIAMIKTSVISSNSKELFDIAMKYVHLTNLLNYLNQTILAITEAWETILLEMDSKLAKYASNVPEGAVCADFLDLLMVGVPSDEMEEFLMQDLTDKGLKKLGHSIELSYSNIQKLLLTHMNTCGQNITYHLAELRGMARFTHRYKILGLKKDSVTNAINANGAFLVKSIEVQQVINQSMSNYKAFFRWLYVVILRLMDEQVPNEIPKMTQQDLIYITEFLKNFDSIPTKEDSTSKNLTQKNKFHLEQLGQYLLDAPLTILSTKENSVWRAFLEENECVSEHSMIVKPNDNLSLVQQQKILSKSIHDIFVEPKMFISNNFNFKVEINLIDSNSNHHIQMSQINNELSTFIAFLDGPTPANGIHLLDITTALTVKQIYLYATNFSAIVETECNLKILDVQFYTLQYLSILLTDTAEKNCAFLCQVPLSNILERMWKTTLCKPILTSNIEKCDICKIEGLTIKAIEGMSVSCFAVSGTRHVSVVLSDTLHKVQLFEMEADEEEDDETETTMNNTQDTEAMTEESIISELKEV